MTDDEIIAIRKTAFGGRFGVPRGGPWSDTLTFARALLEAAAKQPSDRVSVPLTFVQGFNTMAHNYSLNAQAPDWYHGVERDAFANAYKRCSEDLAKLRAMLTP